MTQNATSSQSTGPALTKPSRPLHVNVTMLDHNTVPLQNIKPASTLPISFVDPWNVFTDEDVEATPPSVKQSQAWRWNFERTEVGPIARRSKADSPEMPPITIPINQDWKCFMQHSSLTEATTTDPTVVSVVLCISLSGLSTDEALESLRFVSTYKGMKLADITIQEDELRGIAKQDAVRLRLHEQMPFYEVFNLEVSINVMSAASAGTYTLYYIEMDYCNQATNDTLLYGLFKPHLSVQVGCSIVESLKKTVTVHSHCVSRSGAYAATLCFHAGRAILEVWDIASTGETPSLCSPQQLLVPSAWGSVPVVGVPKPDNTTISISCSGLDVAFFTDGSAKSNISFQLMAWTSSSSCNDKDASPKTLSSRRPCNGLHGFLGFGAFITAKDDVHENKCERYIACDGITVSVYSTYGEWSLLQTITLSPNRNMVAARNVTTSGRGQYFAWTGDRGIVPVWDMENAKNSIHIELDHEITEDSPVKFSGDGQLMAICSGNQGAVAIYQLPSGAKLGAYRHGAGAGASNEVIFVGDHLAVPSPSQAYTRTVICTRTMEPLRSFSVNGGYRLEAHRLSEMVYSSSNGSVVDIIKLKAEDASAIHTPGIELQELPEDNYFTLAPRQIKTLKSHTGTLYGFSLAGDMIKVTFSTCSDVVYIPLGVDKSTSVLFVFLPQACKLHIITDHLYIWNLPRPPVSKDLDLVQVWALLTSNITGFSPAMEAFTYDEGRQCLLVLIPSTMDTSEQQPGDQSPTPLMSLAYPECERDNIPLSEQDRISQGVRGAANIYKAKTPFREEQKEQNNAVIRYLNTLVRPSSKNPTSCIVTLCHLWNSDESSQFEAIIHDLLSWMFITSDLFSETYGIFTWIPDATLKDSFNPIAILMEKAETHPEAFEAAIKVIEYCVHAACCTRNLVFLSPVYGSLRELMTFSPETVLRSLKKGIIHIQNRQHRSFIVRNHIIAHPPRVRLRFWNAVAQPLDECRNPIMQLHVSPVKTPMASKFNREVFLASFDALWLRHDASEAHNKHGAVTKTTTTSMTGMATAAAEISWWQVLSSIIQAKILLKGHRHVECYVYNLEFFDNPAIAALVAYKWNTIGFSYWLLRFACQCIYYVLVLTATLLQVYSSRKTLLVSVFIAIVIIAAAFIWLEVTQALHDWKKYKRSNYNVLDVLAFTLPLGASIDQLLDLIRTEPSGNVRPLSFAVLVVFLHMLFELRINKSVCKHVTIIQHILYEIRIFFFIFAAGIATFSTGLMHLLHGCPLRGCKHDPAPTFSRNFLSALSSTYFFMGGRYDSVDDKLDSEDWAFHLMMVSFFFFTVILMLNVLIALINVAFIKGDDVWRLTWVESRLRYIEAAENMSYHIPGFREAYNWFPSEIYYTMTRDQWRAYERSKLEDEDV